MDELIVCFLLLFDAFLCKSDFIKHTVISDGIKEPLFKSAVPDFRKHIVVEPVIYKNNDKLVSTFVQGGHVDDIVLQFTGFAKNFIIDLKRNRNLFSQSYLEKSFTKEGEEIYRPAKHKESHCFYHGSIHDHKHSIVALSTCDGLSGYIYDGQESYHIEPAFDISSKSHRLYRDSDSVRQEFQCGAHPHGHSMNINGTRQILHKNEVLHRMRRELRGPPDSNTNTRFVEMYVVNDFRTFDANGRNLPRLIRKTQNIVNIVSMLYHPFNIHIALVGIEVWTQQDRFSITTEADSTLENFLHYRRSRINPYHPNDNAQLITDTTFAHGVVGKAIKGTICTFQYSGGVNLNLATEGQTAATIAHELGHNFGMDHDNYTYCQCKDDKCIMAATSGGINTPTQWSSCSMLALQEAFEMGMDYCLKNKPAKLEYGTEDCIESGQCQTSICGNGFTEPGEECDCGLPEVCDTRCCNATTCKLTPGSQCATGLCCDLNTCKPKPAATMCRAPVGECDLPEFCWGTSQYCPDDVYLQDGVECYSGQSYCYKGQCKTHTGQCKLLWGTTGRVSDPVCFKHLNTNGSKHGNCGYNWTTEQYLPCLRDDVMCGLLHCVHQNEKLMFWKDNLAHATPATFLTIGPKTYICRGAMLDVGVDMPDPGMVPEGAKCEDRKMCINNKCTAISTMGFPSCPAGCSDRGVCNSKGHCHCEEGFGGPVCDESGNGGSVDSGPVKIEESKGLLIGLLVFFLVICPLLGITAFFTYRYRGPILAWWHQNMSSLKHKQTSRPPRPSQPPPPSHHPPPSYPPPPSHPPPKREQTSAASYPPPPPYPGKTPAQPAAGSNRPRQPLKPGHVAVVISDPVLTGSTHKDSQTHIQPSPKPPVKPMPPAPPRPAPMAQTEEANVTEPSVKLPTKTEPKSRFGPIFKIPSLGKSQDTASPKLGEKKQENAEPEIVKRRELTREISNPVLISTTDRRSQHLVKLENIHVEGNENKGVPAPPVPPKISLNRSDSDFTKSKNKPLPPRPVSMPPSESGEEIEMDIHETKTKKSTKFPQRPPPPHAKLSPDVDTSTNRPAASDTRQTIEDEISKLDQIKVEIPVDSADESSNVKPSMVKSEAKKPLKPKTPVKKSISDSTKKSLAVSKKPATQTKSDSKVLDPKPASKTKSDTKPKGQWTPADKPIFKPKNKPVTKKTSQMPVTKIGKPEASTEKVPRKDSTDSLDEEGESSVYARKKIFEGQKKPLLGTKSDSDMTTGGPQTPPKPGGKTVKQIRSVNV